MGHHRFKIVLTVTADVEEPTKNKQLPADPSVAAKLAQRLMNLDVGEGYAGAPDSLLAHLRTKSEYAIVRCSSGIFSSTQIRQ